MSAAKITLSTFVDKRNYNNRMLPPKDSTSCYFTNICQVTKFYTYSNVIVKQYFTWNITNFRGFLAILQNIVGVATQPQYIDW